MRRDASARRPARRLDAPARRYGGAPTPTRVGLEDADRRPVVPEADQHGMDQPADLIWGRHSAQAALESGRPIHRIWCTAEMRFSPRFLQLLREAKSSGVLVEEVTWARLGQLTGGAVHQGIVLQTAAAETLDLPGLIEGCRAIGEPPLLMALDGITDPHNLGAIARSAEALGAHGLVLPQRRSAGLTGSVAKVAAGALEHLPVARVVNLNRALDSLKQEGYRVIGLASEGNLSLEEADLEGPLVIVTGSEADGLAMLTRKHCDQLVSIPLRGATPSLNASVATALLLYEVARRGWMKGLKGGQPAPRLQRPRMPVAAAAEVPGPEPDAPGPYPEASQVPGSEPLADSAATPPPNPDPGPDPGPGPDPDPDPGPTDAMPEPPGPEAGADQPLEPAAAPAVSLDPLTPASFPDPAFARDIQL
ncbi:23S rRNA (guanosine(2251)-2'-O)-methyltransferase RlmB [Cyanobium sp. NIES-981]|uniref:23S rRNA (guanosine(2251)-2'-O)-methyltransferase RlmB n=1 Tax=Cyanobium sp. NIES-981 TaxID=1851505 RepID=UPI000B35D8F2